MTKRSHGTALGRRLADFSICAPASDDEIAESIIDELDLNRSTNKAWAISRVKCCIEDLRDFVDAAGLEPQPGKAKDTIEQITKHAEALASCIEKLSPKWRWYLSFSVFNERNRGGAVIVGHGPDKTADRRMSEWINYLKRVPHDFGQMQNSPRDFFPGAKASCAFKARELILALSPTTKLTKGDHSKFYKIANWLWYAATGDEQSLKRACDANIDWFRSMQRAVAAGQSYF